MWHRVAIAAWLAASVVFVGPSPGSSADGRAAGAQWIWIDGSGTPNSWVILRREFDLTEVPPVVETRIAADSKYWLWVNGELVVFEGGLKRGPRPDATWVDVIDLAPYLRAGTNCVAALVWYWGKHGFSHVDSGAGGFLFDADSGSSPIVTDSGWKALQHPAYLQTTEGPQPSFILAEHNIRFDARLDVLGEWTQIGYDHSSWPNAVAKGEPPVGPWGELEERRIPMWRFTEISDFARKVVEPTDGEQSLVVAQLPYNAQVTAYLEVEAPPGLTIDMRTDNYEIGTRNSVRTEYVTRDGVQSFESLGWFNGDEVHFTIPDGVSVRRLGYRESGFDTEFVGSFVSDSSFFDRLWLKAARTTYVNMRDTFMDCPDRERAQWWGDIVNEMPQAFYAFDDASHGLVRKAISDLVEWRKDGVVLHSPIPGGNVDWELPIQMLASIGHLGFWQYYLHTGDAAPIITAFDHVVQYLDLWSEATGGLVDHRPGDWDWADWGQNIDTPVIENAWFALALQGAIEMSHVVSAPDVTAVLEARLLRLESGFEQGFWTGASYRSQGHSGPPDDRANGLAVLAGLVPKSRWPAIRSVLVDERHSSPFMERFVLEALFRMGFAGDALARMEDRFGPMVDDSQTTLWENWNRDAGSDNHGWAGGPLYLLSAHVAGIAPETPGWSRFRVRPQLALLGRVSCTVPTIQGPVSVSHSRSGVEHRLDLEPPPGTTAVVGMPATSLGGDPVLEVSANGSVVWGIGGPTDIPGVTFVGVSPDFITFEVDPGLWILVARSTPAGIFSDDFESGDTVAW